MGIYVIGMHRSGTSALAGALSALGQLPAGRLAVGSNPAGQWERPELRPALELILAWNRATWASPQPESRALVLPAPLRSYAARVFDRHCRGPFLWKDPRLCLTIDRWLALPQETPRVVFINRRPAAVARSLRRRNGWSLDRGLALWERTNRNAVVRLGGREVFAVDHDDLLADPDGVITELADWLGLDDGGARARAVATIERSDAAAGPAGDGPGHEDHRTESAPLIALAERLGGASGPTRLTLDGVGPESTATGTILAEPSRRELARRTSLALLDLPRRHHVEVAGAPPAVR